MPSTPRVNFNFINNNVEESSPLQGISMVLARTVKGPALDPSQLITSISQFKRVYGSEIVPDGSVSNIERALIGGSKLRIIRVMGAGSKQGSVGNLFTVQIGDKSASVKLITRGFGDPIGTGETFTVTTKKQGNTLYYTVLDANQSILESGPIFSYLSANDTNLTSIDYLALSSWINTNPYFKVLIDTESDDLKSVEKFLTWLAENDGTKNTVVVTPTASLEGSIGSVGGVPKVDAWQAAAEYIRDYTDAYNILASHATLHLGNSKAIELYKTLKEMCDELNEYRLFIEIPKYQNEGPLNNGEEVVEGGNSKPTVYDDSGDGNENNGDSVEDGEGGETVQADGEATGAVPMDVDQMINWKKTCSDTIGHSKWVSYYGAGLMYNNNFGIAQGSDVGGTVLGLADTSATNYGYHKSFAGLNRGIATDAQGTVSPNYGSPGRIDQLERLAQECINLFVVRDTPSFGKRTLLWHNFTDQVKQDSFRFLGNTGLVLNIKKTLRPILESYIEEPNIWGTWHDIYLRVRPLIDSWVDSEAMTDPKWDGDQDANSWDDLKVNTEADCRQGRYHVVFSFKDIVALQDITLDVVIEKASKSVEIDVIDNS